MLETHVLLYYISRYTEGKVITQTLYFVCCSFARIITMALSLILGCGLVGSGCVLFALPKLHALHFHATGAN